MNELRTIRYLGREWYLCLSRGCTCIMKENTPEFLAAHPGAPTHYCADWECRGRAWIVDGTVKRVRAEPPNENARARRALHADFHE